MRFIKIDFPDSVFSAEGPRNSFMEDPPPGMTIPAVGMFLNPVFDAPDDAGDSPNPDE